MIPADFWVPGLVAAMLFLIGRIAFALWRGRLRAGREIPRRGDPAAFRGELAVQLLILLILAFGLLLIPPPGDRDPGDRYRPLFIFAVLAPLLIRALWRREVITVRRDHRPVHYWSFILAFALVGVMAVAELHDELTAS